MIFEHTQDQMDIYKCTFEITINSAIQRQTIQSPRMIIEQQFMSLVEQAYQDNRKIMAKMNRPIDIWDFFDKKCIRRENSIVVKNRAYANKEK